MPSSATEAGQPQDLKAAEIMAALAARDPLARETAKLYMHLLGQELGNLALIHLPFGGIYLIGGVARAMVPYMDEMNLARGLPHQGPLCRIHAKLRGLCGRGRFRRPHRLRRLSCASGGRD